MDLVRDQDQDQHQSYSTLPHVLIYSKGPPLDFSQLTKQGILPHARAGLIPPARARSALESLFTGGC